MKKVKVKYFCDWCEQEMNENYCVTFCTFVKTGIQDTPTRFDIERFANFPWRGKEVLSATICNACVEEEIGGFRLYDDKLSFKDDGLTLLKNIFKWIRKYT